MNIDLADFKNFKLRRFIQDGEVQAILQNMYEILEEARFLADSSELTNAYLLVSLLDYDDPRLSGVLELNRLFDKLANEGDFISRVGKIHFQLKGEEVDHEKPLPRATRKQLRPISDTLKAVVSELDGYRYKAWMRIAEDAMLELSSLNEGPRPGGLIDQLNKEELANGQSGQVNEVDNL